MVVMKSRRHVSRKKKKQNLLALKTMLWDPTSAQTRFERLAKNFLDRHENPRILSLLKILTSTSVPSLVNLKQTEYLEKETKNPTS